MVTISECSYMSEKYYKYTFSGKSTDQKPIRFYNRRRIYNGSLFDEMDTGILYYYDGDTDTWETYGGEG